MAKNKKRKARTKKASKKVTKTFKKHTKVHKYKLCLKGRIGLSIFATLSLGISLYFSDFIIDMLSSL